MKSELGRMVTVLDQYAREEVQKPLYEVASSHMARRSLFGNIQPKPALMVEKVSFPEGEVAVVEVQPSRITPVKYKGTTYVRIGPRKSEANEEEERILREKSELKSPTYDTTPCLHSTIDDLDLDLFQKEYLPKFVDADVCEVSGHTHRIVLFYREAFSRYREIDEEIKNNY